MQKTKNYQPMLGFDPHRQRERLGEPEPTARQMKEGWERFQHQQEKRAAKRALEEERKKEQAVADDEKIARSRKRREEMHLKRLADERKKREHAFFVKSPDTTPELEREVVEIVGHARAKLR